jgi:hypothetical protein
MTLLELLKVSGGVAVVGVGVGWTFCPDFHRGDTGLWVWVEQIGWLVRSVSGWA